MIWRSSLRTWEGLGGLKRRVWSDPLRPLLMLMSFLFRIRNYNLFPKKNRSYYLGERRFSVGNNSFTWSLGDLLWWNWAVCLMGRAFGSWTSLSVPMDYWRRFQWSLSYQWKKKAPFDIIKVWLSLTHLFTIWIWLIFLFLVENLLGLISNQWKNVADLIVFLYPPPGLTLVPLVNRDCRGVYLTTVLSLYMMKLWIET